MNIKFLLLVFLIIFSSSLAQNITDRKQGLNYEKYFDQINKRFLLPSYKPIEQVSSYLKSNNFTFANNPSTSSDQSFVETRKMILLK